MISVVILARDRAERLLDLVASILPQLESYDEIIIVVGATPVGMPSNLTGEIAAEIARQIPLVRVLNGEGFNESDDIAQAVNACRGVYTFIAEPGDIWQGDKVPEVLNSFASNNSCLVLHDTALIDTNNIVIAPSLFAIKGSRPGFAENLVHNVYLGSSMAFLTAFREFFIPIPSEVNRYEQWIGFIVEQLGGASLVAKPLVIKRMAAGDRNLLESRVPREQRNEQRTIFKAYRKRERQLTALLKSRR
jgi:hypothetical protein